ncbi:ParB/RepB/Spo0J family partition protein [Brevundimonas balnearis]|uniref:ParB/RepB/Spo0J family partition protein n=1 Tax=Brevundimonas balnearis TaxID=1572858 RepID=A0ABV6R269_9CAUL
MSERQRGLGRGLSALLGEDIAIETPVAGAVAAQGGVRLVPIESIRPNPDQPRRRFAQAELDELAASIRDKGVLQPILVREQPGEPGIWQIIAGERRWRAAQAARLSEAPIIVREMNDVEVLEVAIIENVQRADLNPVEEAQAYRQLMDRFGRTQDALAGVVGKSRSHVANVLRLLQLPDPVLEMVADGRLSAGHARALVTTPDPAALAEEVLSKSLNVRQTEALARQAVQGVRPRPAGRSAPRDTSPDIVALEHDLAEVLGLGVQLTYRDGRGDLKLRFESLEQLDDLCRRLMR